MTERQTPEQIAEDCLLTNDDPYLNDSMYLPVDLKARIARAIEDATNEAYERAALAVEDTDIVDVPHSWDAQLGDAQATRANARDAVRALKSPHTTE